MNQVIAVGGPPASGKTTLLLQMIRTWDATERAKLFQKGLLKGTLYEKLKIYVLGIYDGQTFAGTDRLSMQVQRDAESFIRLLADKQKDWTVVFEGDRLFNSSFLHVCESAANDLLVVVLRTDANMLQHRHVLREDSQDETWLKGRATKVENVAKEFDNCTYIVQHIFPTHTARIADAIVRLHVAHCSEFERALGPLAVVKPRCEPRYEEIVGEDLPI